MQKAFAATLTLLLAALVSADIPAHKITSLPGWNKTLPSVQYSGLLPVGNKTKSPGFLHYWFITSEGNPQTDPVVLWLNGGPGSSSLIGALTENGQFTMSDASFGAKGQVPELFYNEYGWPTKASVIYLESPKGVGFSHCVSQPCVNTDESTASDAADFLQAFFASYSEYASLPFYITGESYAGIYIPMLMDQVDQRGGINLKGAAIGDGCWGNAVGTCAFGSGDSVQVQVEFFQGHGMYPQTLYNEIIATCTNFSARSVKCQELLGQMNLNIGNFDIYNIYDDCGADQMTLAEMNAILSQPRVTVENLHQSMHPHPALRVAGALNDYACGSGAASDAWLAEPTVAAAFHVEPNMGGMQYDKTVDDLRPLYHRLAQKYRMLIYSGNVDACVPYYGTEVWTREQGFVEKEAWRPWLSGSVDKPQSSQQAGYVVTYTTGPSSPDFTFLTISGAGHLVPLFKPVRALAMFERFLANAPF